jgi:XTP/dITP diphosphohydrolase
MHRLLIGTTNPGKSIEIQALLEGLRAELVLPQSIGLPLGVDETGASYEDNAALKARMYARQAGMWALADDTGLEVQALSGRPGLHSARLVPHGTDAGRRARLLAELDGKPRPWGAVFRCVVAVANPAGQLFTAEGECQGQILPEARGLGGFGYDRLFQVDGTDLTLAEMSLEEKNRVSHRSRAIRALRATLEKLFDDGEPGD